MRFAHAAAVLVLVVTAPHTEAADGIGRLFFSPDERAALERARRAVEPSPVVAENPVVEPEPDVIPEVVERVRPTITVDGYVRRSRGPTTVWLNGESSYDGNPAASEIESRAARVTGKRVRVVPIDDDAVLLKPGQSYDPNTATTVDAYEQSVVPGDAAL